jgi:hypothetical protein
MEKKDLFAADLRRWPLIRKIQDLATDERGSGKFVNNRQDIPRTNNKLPH